MRTSTKIALTLIGLGSGLIFADLTRQTPDEKCAELKIEMLAFTQCLQHQPACQMQKGVEAFIRYYKIHDIIENECRNHGDDDQSQSIKSNSNGKE